MNIKLVASDLDGTLLDDSYQVPQDVKNTVKAMVNKGVAIAIATGRMHRSAINAAKQLKTDVPIISYNGAMIKRAFSGEVLRHVTMPEDPCDKVVTIDVNKNGQVFTVLFSLLYNSNILYRTSSFIRISYISTNSY